MMVRPKASIFRNRGATRGFSLVELAATLAVVGVLAAVALPRFFGNRIFSERGYADELAAALRHAQRVAVATGCNVRFVSNAAGYSARQGTPFNNCRTPATWNVVVQRTDGGALAGAPPAGTAVAPAVQIEFHPTGVPLAPTPQIAVGAFAVDVDPATGRATVTP